jgi:hypothetical protein
VLPSFCFEFNTAVVTADTDVLVAVPKYRATIPATCGEAIDVPDIVAVAELVEIPTEVIEDPGA